ncbi:scavenger receptor class B member 1-like isoform X1 [Diorhabda sublineata]|uniref:scavenger receptor class B member 1-like isoform X1 n=1 Tax=Diorhabda sublineata TaxID=1163346 RepID=UPI0024E16B7D|nr:scavenger receptor class B member 1-like isoform X1 [Diorhabda sublineata]
MSNLERELPDTNTDRKLEPDNNLDISKTFQETLGLHVNIFSHNCKRRFRSKCSPYLLGTTSILFFVLGLLQIVFPPYDILMNLRLRMIPGLPPYEWWLIPPDYGIIKIYLFNVTNAERFLNKTDKKIKLQEIGPIIYRENLIHKNIIFNENGTLTYTSNRTLEYLPERNPVNLLNKTVVMPNIAVLFIPSYLYDAPFFIRFGVNLMMRKLKSLLFKTGTIHDFLWNMSDPILETSQQIAPSLVRTKNVGFLKRIYDKYEDTTTVYIGPKYDERYFYRIDKYDGSEYMPYLTNCKEKVQGSIDDVMYFQGITKNDTLRFFKKTLCRVANLNYAREFERYGLKGYRFEMDQHFYNRTYPIENDCYRGKPILPNGLIDVSACNFDSSVAASYPHFLYAEEHLQNSVEGLSPDVHKHSAYVEVEPKTGIPLRGAARSQVNIVIKDMRGFNEKLHIFSNLTIPLIWIELAQESLSLKVQWLIYIQVMLMPIFQNILMISTFLASFLLFFVYLNRRRKTLWKQSEIKGVFAFEAEKFLKK